MTLPSHRARLALVLACSLAGGCSSSQDAESPSGTDAGRDSSTSDGSIDAAVEDAHSDTSPDAALETGTGGDAPESGPDALPDAGEDAVGDVVSESDAGPTGPFVVYVDPSGDDANVGATPAQSVLTLTRVQEILEAASPDTDVEVRIAQGTYAGQSVTWTYYHPLHEIAFMPIDYQGGGISSIAGRPVFDGEGSNVLLALDASDGQPTNLSFIYLQIQGYRQFGLLFRGNRNDFDQGWNGSNRVFGCLLTDIGNLANPGDGGYGGLDLVNSRGNVIRNNHFVDVENASGAQGLMHAVYLAHGSSENEIRSNRFVGVSGDPIRVRDGSNRNEVTDNVFEDTGSVAFISDWWCDMDANPACTKPSGECPSWESAFRDNELHCGYDGGSIATFHYFQGETYVPSWCVDHGSNDGWARLHTSGNAKTCP
jgi:Right handed beta helix region